MCQVVRADGGESCSAADGMRESCSAADGMRKVVRRLMEFGAGKVVRRLME